MDNGSLKLIFLYALFILQNREIILDKIKSVKSTKPANIPVQQKNLGVMCWVGSYDSKVDQPIVVLLKLNFFITFCWINKLLEV